MSSTITLWSIANQNGTPFYWTLRRTKQECLDVALAAMGKDAMRNLQFVQVELTWPAPGQSETIRADEALCWEFEGKVLRFEHHERILDLAKGVLRGERNRDKHSLETTVFKLDLYRLGAMLYLHGEKYKDYMTRLEHVTDRILVRDGKLSNPLSFDTPYMGIGNPAWIESEAARD